MTFYIDECRMACLMLNQEFTEQICLIQSSTVNTLLKNTLDK